MPPDSPLSEADIQAYADGTLTPERIAYLRDYLGKDPAEARRVAFYGRLNAQIQAAFQTTDEPSAERGGASASGGASGGASDGGQERTKGVKETSGTRRARNTKGAGKTPPRGRLLNTLAALFLTAAAASGWIAASQVSAQALSNAAVMQLAETAAAPFPAATPTRADPDAPDLTHIGLRLVDRKVLSLGPLQRADEYVYLNGDNQPVVLISTQALFAPGQPQWAARRVGDLRLLSWTTQQRRFVVAGDARTHGLMRAADVMTMH
nr:hypothetical protein HUO10_005655 [Paraburkholderia busanensis]